MDIESTTAASQALPLELCVTEPCPECMHREGCKARQCLHPEACVCRSVLCENCYQRIKAIQWPLTADRQLELRFPTTVER